MSGGSGVANLNEPNLFLALSQRLHNAVKTLAGLPEDDLDAPFVQRVDQNVCSRLRH
jgi:hypothetical protein